jgi:hypothetical protein
MPIAPQKGFKESWLEVYKKNYRTARNLTKENFAFECATLRKHGKGPLISGIDCWSNFVIATTGRNVIVYLLDEEDREEADLPMEKIIMPNEVVLINIQEVEWNICRLTVLSINAEIKQFLLTQDDIKTFTIDELPGLPQIFDRLTPFIASVSDNFLILSRDTYTKQDFYGEEQVSAIVVIDMSILSQRSVELERPDEEMK